MIWIRQSFEADRANDDGANDANFYEASVAHGVPWDEHSGFGWDANGFIDEEWWS